MKFFKRWKSLTLFFVFVVLWRVPNFLYLNFGKMNLDQIFFVLLGNNEGANLDIVFVYLKSLISSFIIALIINLVFILIVDHLKNKKLEYSIILFKLKKNGSVFLGNRTKTILTVLFITLSVFSLTVKYDNKFDVFAYVHGYLNAGTFYEDNYINPQDVSIEFPEEKRNLIYIITESMNTNFTSMNIDGKNVNLIPKLEKLANENIFFSDSEEFGGLLPIRGTTWTMGSLVGQTAGVPLSGPLESGNAYGDKGRFLPGIVTIGEILEENGYENYYAIGSDSSFAGRDTYFTTHGNYEIYDLNYWKEEGKIPHDYRVFWGMEDNKLFEYSKEKLLEISSKGEPFNYSLLTVDSHFTDGYTDEACELPYTEKYANAISCSDTRITDFVEWIQDQHFYENTTIIVVGDHSTMNTDFLELSTIEKKRIYNSFINTEFSINSTDSQNRYFSVLDMFPTTLASLGAKVEGERLGLGTNLFSERKTLIEELGPEVFFEQLSQRSNYYNSTFHLGDEKK